MNISQERDFNQMMENGNNFLAQAETFYEEGKISVAIKKYYHASMCFEMAKNLAKTFEDFKLKYIAKDREFYCNEKIDELETFRKVHLQEHIK